VSDVPSWADKAQHIAQIHALPGQLVLAIAGGGTAVLSDLCAVPGASQTLLEAHIPYAKESFIQYVGREPDKFVSWEGVCLLAGNGLRRALQLHRHKNNNDDTPCSGSLAPPRWQPKSPNGESIRHGWRSGRSRGFVAIGCV
jgi:hypothetical protein